MAPAFLDRLRQRAPAAVEGADGGQPQPPQPPPHRRPPTPGQLRRERRALVRAREERIRDLGGLMLEMYKRERFKPELFFDQCADLISMEERIQELDGALVSATRQTLAEANRCTCGAPLVWGAHFCANCGRAVGEVAVVTCAYCGNPLPAEVNFCASCGRPAEPAEPRPAEAGYEGQEATMAGEGSPDPWGQ